MTDTPVSDQLAELANQLLDALGPILAVGIPVLAGMWAMTYAWKLFRVVARGPVAMPDELGPPPKPTTSSALVTFTAPEAFEACDCPACRKGWAHTAPELTPPTLADWEGWRKYGLIGDDERPDRA